MPHLPLILRDSALLVPPTLAAAALFGGRAFVEGAALAAVLGWVNLGLLILVCWALVEAMNGRVERAAPVALLWPIKMLLVVAIPALAWRYDPLSVGWGLLPAIAGVCIRGLLSSADPAEPGYVAGPVES